MLDSEEWSDIIQIFVGHEDKRFFAHRRFLTKAPVFAARLAKSSPDANNGVIRLPEVDPTAFAEILDFLYSDRLRQFFAETANQMNDDELMVKIGASGAVYNLAKALGMTNMQRAVAADLRGVQRLIGNRHSSLSLTPVSPTFQPSSPGYGPSSPGFSPTSPSFTPNSPMFSPTSPSYGGEPVSPSYSPTSPKYNPISPQFSLQSPGFTPTSPSFSPTSPQYNSNSPKFSPSSPQYDANPPQFSLRSPRDVPARQDYFSASMGLPFR